MSQPVVVIVGRPNVGKSTLFNRIIKKREAIVDDQPGVTRDRLYSQADWQGQNFLVVDTGGYLPQARDEMEHAIREQVEIAIQESDVILYIVDRTTGITDWDQEIAVKLQKAGKPVLLLVNKIDNEAMTADLWQFYALGLGDPLPVSAIHGRLIGDMLDRLVKQLRQVPLLPQPENAVKLAVIGRENVGKSSFVNTLIGQKRSIVTAIPGTTRDPIDSLLNYQKRKYLLIDTAGLKKRAKMKENILFYSHLRTLRSIQRADVVLYFVDASEGPSRQDMRILDEAARHKRGMVLVVNKWDLIPKDNRTMRTWEVALREKLGAHHYVPVLFVSVLEKQRLYKVLDLAQQVYDEMQKNISTSDLNAHLLPIIQETSPPSAQGKEIKINYITQVNSGPPVFAFFCNFPRLITESYRRFLERKIREIWGFQGVPLTIAFKAKHKKR